MTRRVYDPGECYGCPPGSGCSTANPGCPVCYRTEYKCDGCGEWFANGEHTMIAHFCLECNALLEEEEDEEDGDN